MKNLKITNLSEKDIQNLKKIEIIEPKEIKLQDLKILKVKIQTAIKNIEKRIRATQGSYFNFPTTFPHYFHIFLNLSTFLLTFLVKI